MNTIPASDFRCLLQRLAIPLLLVVVASCAGGTSIPENHYYRLPEIAVKDSAASSLLVGQIAVSTFATDGLYHERPVVYLDINRPLELKRYHYRHWVHPPAILVQHYLYNYLKKVQPDGTVVKNATGQRVDAKISGRILQFDRKVGGVKPTVHVKLELFLGGQNADPETKRFIRDYRQQYTREVEVADYSLHAMAESFGLALQQIFQQFVDDAAAAQLPDLAINN